MSLAAYMTGKTVFIIGAGASCEVGLPVGKDLIKQIGELLDFYADGSMPRSRGDQLLYDALHELAAQQTKNTTGRVDNSEFMAAAAQVSKGMRMASSIDMYLEQNRHNEKIIACGKAAIARAILKGESGSLLRSRQGYSPIDNGDLTRAWYGKFFQTLTDRCSHDELETRFEQVVFIIFNYDRCVERYLELALQYYYPEIDRKRALDLISDIEIYRPYGSVGALQFDSDNHVPFGDEPFANKLVKISGGIRTFTEQTRPDDPDIDSIRFHMQTAQRMIFLGFAFNQMNLDLMMPERRTGPSQARTIYATSLGISLPNLAIIKQDLAAKANMHADSVNFCDMKCTDAFDYFSRGFAFEKLEKRVPSSRR